MMASFISAYQANFLRIGILKNFILSLLKIVRDVSYEFRNIEYLIVKDEHRKMPRENKNTHGALELPLEEFYINKSDNLNPRYTFDTFVIGSFNNLAYVAAQAALNRPGITYNPLFIYGDTGRGKTHLIQAIGNQFKKQYQGRKVFYLTSEKFAVDYTDSVQAGTANRFKDKYRQYDLLIMDDVQFLSKKIRLKRSSSIFLMPFTILINKLSSPPTALQHQFLILLSA